MIYLYILVVSFPPSCNLPFQSVVTVCSSASISLSVLKHLSASTDKVKAKGAPVLNQVSTVPRRHMGEEGIAPLLLTLSLDGGEWSTIHSRCFTPGGRVTSTHCVGGWVVPRISLDTVEKKNLVLPGIESRPSSLQSIAMLTLSHSHDRMLREHLQDSEVSCLEALKLPPPYRCLLTALTAL